MKKKSAAVAAALSLLLVFSGCSYFDRETAPRDVRKEYFDIGSAVDYASPSEYIAATQAGAVVSIVASCYVSSGSFSYTEVTEHTSGVILNNDGYVLTTTATTGIPVESDLYRATSVYAVLAPVYDDDTLYRLDEVAYDLDSGLAIYKFYDNFSYTDANGESRDGFQFTAELSDEPVNIGIDCWAVGNSLGDLFEGAYELTMTSGVVSDDATDREIFPLSYNGTEYDFIQTTIPTTPEMAGGALFDENGYMVGLFASRIVSESGNSAEYLDKCSLFYKTDIIQAYVNHVSETLETVITLSVASGSSEAA